VTLRHPSIALLALTLAGCASTGGGLVADAPVKIGKPYVVAGRTYYPADDRGYDRTGLASWYGGKHHGRATANGERFDRARVSAAHPTLPLPSYVEVTALESGRRILVRVNDRGPFAEGRIIDLSQAAAQALGTERQGIARVRVRRVFPAERDREVLRLGGVVRLSDAAPGGYQQELHATTAQPETITP
jgi:rare lipoprotein A